ncbi:MAG: type II toxin-antitoxin system RelE/ParE family toxin [Alcanivoracaceae bacterium]|nr:type II toxin-antitoxin system RelE/ParE family toxin [Alcanivoracaceae bacterium]
MRRLVILDVTKQQLKSIKRYTFKKWGKQQSVKYVKELRQMIILLFKNPLLGIQKPDINNMAFGFPCGSHVIYYYFNDDKVIIVGVLHKSMLPKQHLQGIIL